MLDGGPTVRRVAMSAVTSTLPMPIASGASSAGREPRAGTGRYGRAAGARAAGVTVRGCPRLANPSARLGRLAADGLLHCVQITDALQRLFGERRLRCDVEVVELAPRVRPARRFLDRMLGIGSVEQPIEPGDLLTTSPTKGHAQKALDPDQAAGSIVGKALGSLKAGKGKLPVLVTLR